MLYKVYLKTKDGDIFCDQSFNNEEAANDWFKFLCKVFNKQEHIGDEVIFEKYSLVRTIKIKL